MSDRPVVVFSDVHIEGRMPDYLSDLLARATVLSPGLSTPEAIQAARAEAVVWLARLRTVSQADLEAMPQLKLISTWGVGYNHIDVAAATARGIPVCINPVFTRSVAEAALTLILALAKRFTHLLRDAQAGRRPLESERGMEIRGKTLGIVGFGRIGEDIGDLGHRLEMTVLAYDPHRPPGSFPEWARQVSLETLLQTADFLVLAAALTPETHHLIGARELALMRPTAYLINVGRGPLVDEAALFLALQSGRIAGAGLDVWEQEPLRPDNPLLALENVVATPHKLASTWDSLRLICQSIQGNVFRVLAGERPENVVNPEAFDR